MKSKVWVYVGLSLIVLGLIVNPRIVAAVALPEAAIEYALYRTVLWLLAGTLILIGGLMIGYRQTRLPGSIALALISMIVTLAASELVLRVYAKVFPAARPDFRRAGILYEFQASTQVHPRWGWSFRPNLDTVWEEGWKGRERTEIRTRFRTLPIPGYPAYGMRDDGLDADAGTVIPVFGDSFTFGSTVEQEQIWCELIEQRNPHLDLLNLANGGGLTKANEQYKILRDVLPPHDTVIYAMWLGNEFLDNGVFPRDPGALEELQKAHLAETQKRRLQKTSHLAYVVIETVDNLRKALKPQESRLQYAGETDQLWDDRYGNFYLYPANPILLRYAEPAYVDETISIGIQNTSDAIVRMKSLVGERNLVIVLFPFKSQLYDDLVLQHRPELELAKPNQVVMGLCKLHGVTCLDLLPELRKHRSERLFWDYDPHLTSVGQSYASIEIEALLAQAGIFPTEHVSQ